MSSKIRIFLCCLLSLLANHATAGFEGESGLVVLGYDAVDHKVYFLTDDRSNYRTVPQLYYMDLDSGRPSYPVKVRSWYKAPFSYQAFLSKVRRLKKRLHPLAPDPYARDLELAARALSIKPLMVAYPSGKKTAVKAFQLDMKINYGDKTAGAQVNAYCRKEARAILGYQLPKISPYRHEFSLVGITYFGNPREACYQTAFPVLVAKKAKARLIRKGPYQRRPERRGL